MAVRPATALGVQVRKPRRGTTDRREGPRTRSRPADPRDKAPRSDVEAVTCGVPGVLLQPPRVQRRHRSDQRTHRTPPPHRPWLSKPRQLPTTHATHRRRTHPPPAGMEEPILLSAFSRSSARSPQAGSHSYLQRRRLQSSLGRTSTGVTLRPNRLTSIQDDFKTKRRHGDRRKKQHVSS